MKYKVPYQEVDQRGPGERLCKRTVRHLINLNKEDAVDRNGWRKLRKAVWRSGWMWVGECFFWYQLTLVVLDKGPLNGCVCVCVFCSGCSCCANNWVDHSYSPAWSMNKTVICHTTTNILKTWLDLGVFKLFGSVGLSQFLGHSHSKKHFFLVAVCLHHCQLLYSLQLMQKRTHMHTHTHLMALCPGLPGWAGTRKVKPIWILLKQDKRQRVAVVSAGPYASLHHTSAR